MFKVFRLALRIFSLYLVGFFIDVFILLVFRRYSYRDRVFRGFGLIVEVLGFG